MTKMNCLKISKKIQAYLDQHLSETERGEFETHIKSCSFCRQELKEWKSLYSGIHLLTEKMPVPEGMSRSVMARILQEKEVAKPSIWEKIKHMVSIPRFSLRWMGAAAVSFVTLVFLVNFLWLTPEMIPNGLTEVQFSLRAGNDPLKSVAVVGDFNDWDPEKHLLEDDNGDGIWTATLKLEPGRYEYMFILDGQKWVPDPEAYRYVRDGFGNKNAVIEIANCM